MMPDSLNHYLHLIMKMRTAPGRTFTEATRTRAPHKPILMLSILDLVEQGMLTGNFVPLSPELADLFAGYWDLVMHEDRNGHIFLPFFHMKNDGFWHLIPLQGQETTLEVIRQVSSARQLRDLVLGAQFDEALYSLICTQEGRGVLRSAIIETYFSEALRPALLDLTQTNIAAHRYSLELLEQARHRVERIRDSDETRSPVRDAGFRKAIVAAYAHRCVLCGVRLVTSEGRSAATAAHIIPWSESHNDDPRNGLCLCRLCHWAFDVGLAGITTAYRIHLSSQLGAGDNLPGHLSTLNERPIFEPVEPVFNPDTAALKWHMQNVFLG